MVIYQRYSHFLSEHHTLKIRLPVNKQKKACIEDRRAVTVCGGVASFIMHCTCTILCGGGSRSVAARALVRKGRSALIQILIAEQCVQNVYEFDVHGSFWESQALTQLVGEVFFLNCIFPNCYDNLSRSSHIPCVNNLPVLKIKMICTVVFLLHFWPVVGKVYFPALSKHFFCE